MERGGFALPTEQELREQRQSRASKLERSLKRRPSAETLQQKAILSSSFSEDATNQKLQIEARRLKFRRTSQTISSFLARRPSLERLKERNVFEAAKEGPPPHGDGVEMLSIPSMEDNATKQELRQEVHRLHAMLAEKVVLNNLFRRENETMKSKIIETLDSGTESMARGLKQHSLMETQVLHQTFVDLSKEADDKKMNEMEQTLTDKAQQIELLQRKIRRLSTVDPLREDGQAMLRLAEWARSLSWDQHIAAILEGDDSRKAMEGVIVALRRSSREQSQALRDEMARIRREHWRDKQRFAMSTACELNRLRAQIKELGQSQLARQQLLDSNASARQRHGGYLGTVATMLWRAKK